MILRSLRLERFGRFRAASWEFAPGLTVIRGPNEAGKSTMREAIVRLLFDPTIIGTTSKSFRALRTWGEDRDFVLAGTLEAGGATLTLTKDFDAKIVELREGERLLTDQASVNERLAKVLGVHSRAVYETTACLRQQEFAALDAGREVSALLQQTIAGPGAEAGVRAVLDSLGKQAQALAVGLRGAYKTPGPIRAAQLEQERLAQEIARLRPIVERAEEARLRLDTLTVRAAEIDAELTAAEELLNRVQRRLELQRRLDEVTKQCAQLEATIREARRLGERIEELQEKLAGLPDLSEDQVTTVRDAATERQKVEEARSKAVEQVEALATAEAEAESRLEALKAELPDAELVREAEELQSTLTDAERELALVREQAASARMEREAAQARSSRRRVAVGVGIAVALAGVVLALGFGSAWGWGAAGAGALLAAWAAGGARGDAVSAARRREEQAAARADELQSAIDRTVTQLRALMGEERDPRLLRERLEQGRVELEKAREAYAAACAATGVARQMLEQARQTSEIAAARLQHRLSEAGFDAVEAFLAAAEEVGSLRQKLRDAETARKALLSGRTPAVLDAEFGALNADRRGLQAELETPELAVVADIDATEHVRLTRRAGELRAERERVAAQITEARAEANNPQAEAERLRGLEERQAATAERVAALEERLAVLELTRDLLTQAHEETLAQAIDVLEPHTAGLLAGLTCDRYRRIAFDRADLTPRVYSEEKGAWVTLDGKDADPPTELSCATREQVYLAARLALTRLLWPDELPPIMLDDPFVNFDPQRRREAVAVVRELAAGAQVLLFTCDEHYDDFADAVIVLPGP